MNQIKNSTFVELVKTLVRITAEKEKKKREQQKERKKKEDYSRPSEWLKRERGFKKDSSSQKGRGRFFFSPFSPSFWGSKCKYKEPRFLYSDSWLVSVGRGKVELHLSLYAPISFPEFPLNSIRWQKVVSSLPSGEFSERKLLRYVRGYQKMMRSRQFPDWEKKKRKKSFEKAFKKWGVSLRLMKYYDLWMERQWKRSLSVFLEARLLRLFFSPKEKLSVRIHFIHSPWLTSSLCARYFVLRLKEKGVSFRRLISNFVSQTNFYGGEKHNLYGLYIAGAGRFTKRQRASYMKVQRGRVPFSTPTAPMDYCQLTLPLKYGACSVRVWVCHLRNGS